MKKKIILVGLGNMGLAHLKSFENKKKYKFFIYDKYLKSDQITKKLKNIKNEIEILNKLPSNQKFEYLLICSHSKDRFQTFKKITSKNKIRFALLEKFVFLKKNNFKQASIYMNPKKILVNVWGGILFNMLKMNNYKLLHNTIKVILPEGTLLTNLIHYLYFFSLFNNEKILFEKKIVKIVKSKRRLYHELIGHIILKTKKNTMQLLTRKKIKTFNILTIKNRKLDVKLKIQLPKILLYPNKFINFPTAKKITKKNFDLLENKRLKNKLYFQLPNLKSIEKISNLILDELPKKKNKKILIN
jgi:hypothetical protein